MLTFRERILNWLGLIPMPMLDGYLQMMAAKTIQVATKLDIFSILSRRPASAVDLAKDLEVSERGLSMLLEALAAIGYLKRKGDNYENARVARKWLVKGSPNYVGNVLRHADDCWPLFENLHEAVKTGKTPLDIYTYMSQHPEAWRNFILENKDMATISGAEIIGKLRVPPQARMVLDLGGGHGYHSVLLCRKYPQLNAVVLDLPDAAKVGKEVVSQEGMANRVSFRPGNCVTDDIGGDYDIALLFSIVHSEPEENNIAVINKVYAALKPGGLIAINEVLSYKGKKESWEGLLFAINMLVCTLGRTYSYEQVRNWLTNAGFVNIDRADLRRMPGMSLVQGTKLT